MAVEYSLAIDKGAGFEFEFLYRAKAGHASLIPEGSGARMVMRDVA